MNPPVLSAAAAEWIARLQCHPQLYDHVTALLDEVENRAVTGRRYSATRKCTLPFRLMSTIS